MQVFANIATDVIRKISKTNSAKAFYETRICENHRGGNGSGNKSEATFYTVRIMHDVNPGLVKGDFVKVTGHLKVDSYYSTRDGKPASALLIIAFEALKVKGVDELKKIQAAKLAAAKEAVAA
jgi:single-stranded DNA-binding protein